MGFLKEKKEVHKPSTVKEILENFPYMETKNCIIIMGLGEKQIGIMEKAGYVFITAINMYGCDEKYQFQKPGRKWMQ